MRFMKLWTWRSAGAVLLAAVALGSVAGAQPQGGGSNCKTIPWKNVFGWTVGHVTVCSGFIQSGCETQLVGSVGITDTLPLQSCEVLDVSLTPVECPPTAECPEGIRGQEARVRYRCCTSFSLQLAHGSLGLRVCISDQVLLDSCP